VEVLDHPNVRWSTGPSARRLHWCTSSSRCGLFLFVRHVCVVKGMKECLNINRMLEVFYLISLKCPHSVLLPVLSQEKKKNQQRNLLIRKERKKIIKYIIFYLFSCSFDDSLKFFSLASRWRSEVHIHRKRKQRVCNNLLFRRYVMYFLFWSYLLFLDLAHEERVTTTKRTLQRSSILLWRKKNNWKHYN